MSMNDRWSVRLYIIEIDNETHAEARLVMPDEQELVGRGTARRNPADREVTLIGEQIAASRALSDLAGHVLHTAGLSIESLTKERAHLHALSSQPPIADSKCRKSLRSGHPALTLIRTSGQC